MLITDQRALEFLDLIKAKNQVKFDTEFCEAIGLKKQNLIKIRNQDESKKENHFTAEQLLMIGKAFNANMNFLFGFCSEPFNNKGSAQISTSNIKSNISK